NFRSTCSPSSMKTAICYPRTHHVSDDNASAVSGFWTPGRMLSYDSAPSIDRKRDEDVANSPGASPNTAEGKFDYLSNEKIVEKLLEFSDDKLNIGNLYTPHIHCSSCIWVLENLYKLTPQIHNSQVDFPKKTVRITFDSEKISLREMVEFLNLIGYEPYISLEDSETPKKFKDRSIIYKLGVAGFAFGNVMFLSFPEYFDV